MRMSGLDSSGTRQAPVRGCSECGKASSGSISGEGVLDQLSVY